MKELADAIAKFLERWRMQILSAEQAKEFAATIASRGYSRIGMSMFETNWPAPHREAAAEMGRKLGADLVLYAVVPVGTRLQSVPHTTYQPGQTYSGTTSGVIGGTYGSFHTYGSSPGTFHTQHTTEEVGRYTHIVGYLTRRR
jgi:hypothetical protein